MKKIFSTFIKRKKNIAFIVLLLLLGLRVDAQEPHSFYPFKGFHVGITGQVQFVQKPTVGVYLLLEMILFTCNSLIFTHSIGKRQKGI